MPFDFDKTFTDPKDLTLPRRAEGTPQQAVILPMGKSSVRDFVPSWDYRHRFLAGNRPEVTKDTCGKWAWRGCLEPHGLKIGSGQITLSGDPAKSQDFVDAYRMSCGDLACPICYEKASGKHALRIQNRILQFKRKGRSTKYYHWAVSPPEGDLIKLNLGELWKRAQEISKRAGIQGGCLIFHHLRAYNENDLEEDLASGSSWKTAPASWYFSPHFHVIGVGFTSKKKILHMNEKTGWVVKNLGERKSVRSTALYQLSHAYIPEGRGHAVRWFGIMSYNKLSIKPLPPEKHCCPECGSEFRKLQFVDLEADAIVKSIVTGEGLYRLDHGFFEYAPEVLPPWGQTY